MAEKNNKNIFSQIIKDLGLKHTKERKAIFEQIMLMHVHFDADELFLILRQKKNKVSRGSVYRTLKLFEEAGVIRPVIFTERHTNYERILGRSHHSHLICTGCGKIIEFFNQSLAEGLKEAYKKHNFQETDHKLEATGLCQKCQKKR